MRDYEELVERLRAEQFTVEELSIILPKAANAIEELCKQIEFEHQSGFADGQIAANRKKPRWISVEERLPEDGETVVVFTSRGKISYATRTELGWSGPYSCLFPTHWMPLPEPPKEDDNG